MSLSALLNINKISALKGGHELEFAIKKVNSLDNSKDAPEKYLQSIITRVEKIIVREIKKYNPEDNFLCSKLGLETNNSDITWYIKAISGEQNFIKGYPHFAVSVCSVKEEEVQTALDSVQNLPEASEIPTIKKISWSDRVSDVVISGPLEIEQLAILADEYVSKLYRKGISNTQIMGVSAPIIKVSVPSINLVQYKLPLNHLAKVIASEVDIDPTGEVGNSNRVRSGFSKRSIEDIGNIVIRLPNSQKEIFLRDISKNLSLLNSLLALIFSRLPFLIKPTSLKSFKGMSVLVITLLKSISIFFVIFSLIYKLIVS